MGPPPAPHPHPSPDTIRRHARFSGRVQGVGFRATARGIARGFAITGWVRNEADGSVTLQAQGPAEQVHEYFATLHERLADHIRTTDISTIAAEPGETEFEIRR